MDRRLAGCCEAEDGSDEQGADGFAAGDARMGMGLAGRLPPTLVDAHREQYTVAGYERASRPTGFGLTR